MVQLLMHPVGRVLGMSVPVSPGAFHLQNTCQLSSCQFKAFTQDNKVARMDFRTFYLALATIYLPRMILTLPFSS